MSLNIIKWPWYNRVCIDFGRLKKPLKSAFYHTDVYILDVLCHRHSGYVYKHVLGTNITNCVDNLRKKS